jgi:penicillin-binding protein 1A
VKPAPKSIVPAKFLRERSPYQSREAHHLTRVSVTSLSRRIAILRYRLTPDPADPPSRWLRRHWPWLGLLTLACAGVLAFDSWLGTCGYHGCPSPSEIRAFHPSEGGNVYDRDGRLLGHLENVRRVNVPISDVPLHVRQAFLATEDRRFYEHNGLDWRGVMRAVVRNFSAGGIRQGFSTITMQVAHNSFLLDRYHGRSLRRKLIELRISRLLERDLSKDQILEHYLNVIYLGSGVNGVEAASLDLFGKHVSELTLSEGAVLAALPKAPSTYTPRRNPDRALQRRNLVLSLMAAQGYITTEQEQRSQRAPLRIAEDEWRPSIRSEASALDAVRTLVDSVLPDALKEEGDVNVYTTLDFTAQRAADRTMLKHIDQVTAATRSSFGRSSDGAQGALVALDPATGDIRALVPGKRTQRGGFNRAFNARRQPGSAFKPFVYAAALAAGYSPATPVDDEPIDVQVGNTVWQPANYGDEYAGRITFARALLLSSNAATVRVSRAVGERAVIAAARRNGIVSPLKPVPSIALGAEGVTPVELVAAYAPFANGGMRVTPRLVTRIEAPDGSLLWSTEVSRAPAMDPRDAFEINEMLQGVVNYGTAKAVRAAGVTGPVAGKTGTTNSGEDVWFVGFTPSLVAGVWFGYDTPRPIAYNATGGGFSAPAWAEFYLAGWHEPRGAAFVPPAGMVSAVVDPESGQLATEWCPRRVREWYRPDQVPVETCDLHFGPPPPQMGADAADAPQAKRGDDPIQSVGRSISKFLRKIFRP